jgi:hypothetical protein
MDCFRIAAISVVALPLAILLTPTGGTAESLADKAFSDAPKVRVYRGIEGHPNYRPSGRSGIRVFRGVPNDSVVAPTPPRPDVPNRVSSATPAPKDHFLAASGARTPYPYWPAWRRTNIPTHCAPRWMC